MFSRNGNDNGNGSANGVHRDAAVASRNGNGHKPDAAIVSEHECKPSAKMGHLRGVSS